MELEHNHFQRSIKARLLPIIHPLSSKPQQEGYLPCNSTAYWTCKNLTIMIVNFWNPRIAKNWASSLLKPSRATFRLSTLKHSNKHSGESPSKTTRAKTPPIGQVPNSKTTIRSKHKVPRRKWAHRKTVPYIKKTCLSQNSINKSNKNRAVCWKTKDPVYI